jgi:hypothetical protein
MITFVIIDTDLMRFDPSGQDMTAGNVCPGVDVFHIICPTRPIFFRFCSHGLLHRPVKRAGPAVVDIVAQPGLYDSRLRPDAFVFNHLEPSNNVARCFGLGDIFLIFKYHCALLLFIWLSLSACLRKRKRCSFLQSPLEQGCRWLGTTDFPVFREVGKDRPSRDR